MVRAPRPLPRPLRGTMWKGWEAPVKRKEAQEAWAQDLILPLAHGDIPDKHVLALPGLCFPSQLKKMLSNRKGDLVSIKKGSEAGQLTLTCD